MTDVEYVLSLRRLAQLHEDLSSGKECDQSDPRWREHRKIEQELCLEMLDSLYRECDALDVFRVLVKVQANRGEGEMSEEYIAKLEDAALRIEVLEKRVAERDALIERLVKAIRKVAWQFDPIPYGYKCLFCGAYGRTLGDCEHEEGCVAEEVK